ncbi:hypothetical protein [Nonomuraea sp. NPDC003804]|uniref:hypothetical protein n=1 Tax=Nonomuraea sp. NPDC003804 TaxID=3154547 RepID=UPI0033BEA876
MTRGPWRTPRAAVALTGVIGLVLLSLLLAGSFPAGHGVALRPADASGQSWAPGAEDALLSSLPPRNSGVTARHVSSLWTALRAERRPETGQVPSPGGPEPGAGAIRHPQQEAHRAAGSRSPPLI